MSTEQRTEFVNVGVLLDSATLPAWLFSSLEKVTRLDHVNMVRIDCQGLPHRESSGWLIRLFGMIDNLLFSSRRKPDAYTPKNVDELQISKAVSARMVISEMQVSVCPEDKDQVDKLGLTLIVNCVGNRLQKAFIEFSPGGMWQHAEPADSNSPAGLWEVYKNQAVTRSCLQTSTTNNECILLDETWTTTYGLSPTVNLNYVLWSSSLLLVRQIARLSELSIDVYLAGKKKTGKKDTDSLQPNPEDGSLSLVQVAHFFWIYCYRILSRYVYEKLFWERWYLKYNLDSSLEDQFDKYIDIRPPADEFWADPYVVESKGKYHIFLEVYTQKTGRGHLSVIEMDQRGNRTPPREILVKGYHLSYPQIIEFGDKFYMVPESKENRTIELFECTGFPTEWKFKMNLMDNVLAVDSTLLYYGDRWWMFTVLVDGTGSRSNENLHIFSSAELLTTDWKPHPMNPVVSDARAARPGGKIFTDNQKLFRPAQDCSYYYGYALKIFEIIELTEFSYVEIEVSNIRPDRVPGLKGIHTLAKEGSLTVVDCLEGSRRF